MFDWTSPSGMTSFCPRCEEPLLTDMPGQSDIDAYCARCNQTFNLDCCAVRFADGEFVEGDKGYLDRLTLGKILNAA